MYELDLSIINIIFIESTNIKRVTL